LESRLDADDRLDRRWYSNRTNADTIEIKAMSMGEAGKAAGSVIDALKTQPLVLALVVMNFALIGFVYVQNSTFTTQRQENVKLFLNVQTEVQKLLAQCVIPLPPDRRSDLLPEPIPLPVPKPQIE
jgi:hypothetical protein